MMIFRQRNRMMAAAAFMLAACSTTPAQETHKRKPDSDNDVKPALRIDRSVGQERAYQTRRDRTLSEHERFDFSDIPPGYTRKQWSRAPVLTEGYDRGYEDGFEQGWQAARRAAADRRSTSLHAAALSQGVEHFKNRRYGAAARNFFLAAKQDQGDPLARLHAAHAMVALGHYEDAYHLIRRAFQLQPELALVAMDIRSEYSDVKQFREHLNQLKDYAANDKDDAKSSTVLGYYYLFSDRQAEAHQALRKATRLDPHDTLSARLLNAARISVPAAGDSRKRSRRH